MIHIQGLQLNIWLHFQAIVLSYCLMICIYSTLEKKELKMSQIAIETLSLTLCN